ncbi:MAG: response regulator [Burkholderiales bacterium]|nr:response regulator [Burkholderiales bacterium]
MTSPVILRVLYAEDDRINALLFAESLRDDRSIELRIAEDGAEALAIAQAWSPDVLVLDGHLPDIDGLELLPTLRALPGLSQAAAVMYSADCADEDKARARDAGFDGYWCKPLEPRQVPNLIRTLAGLRKAA